MYVCPCEKRMRGLAKALLTSVCTSLARRQAQRMGKECRVNFLCRFTHKTVIGNNCHFNGMQIHGNGNVVFGENCHSGKECQIFTSYHNYDKGTALPYDSTHVDKNVTVEDNVWIGTRVIILGGVTLGEGSVIQAGSVVVSSIPRCAVAGGAPARVFKMRDIAHYEALKAAKRFL